MNKFKLVYDVVKAMKEKEVFNGTLKVEATKDQEKLFAFDNTFERNNTTSTTKAKMSTEVNCEGKKMKMENNIEFEGNGFGRGHGFMGRMNHLHHGQMHHGQHPHMNGQCQRGHGHCGGFKGGLDRLLYGMDVLSSVKVEEQADKSIQVSLVSADVPEGVKNAIQEHMKQHAEMHKDIAQGNGHHRHGEFMKEFHNLENVDLKLNILISSNNEIEKVALQLTGEQKDENNETHAMNLVAQLSLNW